MLSAAKHLKISLLSCKCIPKLALYCRNIDESIRFHFSEVDLSAPILSCTDSLHHYHILQTNHIAIDIDIVTALGIRQSDTSLRIAFVAN